MNFSLEANTKMSFLDRGLIVQVKSLLPRADFENSLMDRLFGCVVL